MKEKEKKWSYQEKRPCNECKKRLREGGQNFGILQASGRKGIFDFYHKSDLAQSEHALERR